MRHRFKDDELPLQCVLKLIPIACEVLCTALRSDLDSAACNIHCYSLSLRYRVLGHSTVQCAVPLNFETRLVLLECETTRHDMQLLSIIRFDTGPKGSMGHLLGGEQNNFLIRGG